MDNKLLAVLVDIDGTIALRGDRDPYAHEHAMEDAVNWPVVYAVDALHAVYHARIVLVSARKEKFREITEYWLWKHQIFAGQIDVLHMRPNKDQRADQHVKRDIYLSLVEPTYKVQVVFDDRDRVVKMWRELGLTCFQVAPGGY